MNEIPFIPPAEEEFLDAFARYEAARTGLGEEFLAEVERATRRIAYFPSHGSPYLGATRRIVLRRFPYSLVYKPTPPTWSSSRSLTNVESQDTGSIAFRRTRRTG